MRHQNRNFNPKLNNTRIIGRRDLPKVAACESCAHVVELRVIERVIGFCPELESRPFVRGEQKFLEQSYVPIEESGSDNCVFASTAKSLVGSHLPMERGVLQRQRY